MSRFALVVAFVLSSAAAWAGAAPVSTPEPASLMLLATGVAGVAAVKRFRRKK